jgi:hypothetical protein
MAILEYLVSEPPTSTELEAQVLASLDMGNMAARGILNLMIRAVNRDIPAPTNESLLLRIRRQEINEQGIATTILGEGIVNPESEANFQSDSIVIELAEDGELPARARVVKV